MNTLHWKNSNASNGWACEVLPLLMGTMMTSAHAEDKHYHPIRLSIFSFHRLSQYFMNQALTLQ
jgi:hypothetical protein